MRNILYAIAIIFLFGCKKENAELKIIVDLTGKIKSLELLNNYKLLFFYNDTTGKLKKIDTYTPSDTLFDYLISRNENKIYLPFGFTISLNQDGLIKTYKDINNKNQYLVSYTNKLNYFTDNLNSPVFGNTKYHTFSIENGNYIRYLHQYYLILSGSSIIVDTVNISYSNLPFNKYAPEQKLFLYDAQIFDFLGYDDNYLFPQNKNLIKSMTVKSANTQYTNDYDYEFNGLNQLVKMKITNLAGVQEYTMKYY